MTFQGPDGTFYPGTPSVAPEGRWGRFWNAVGRRFKAPEERAISVPWNYGGPNSGAVSNETALAVVPVFACVRILADSIASLPVKAYRKNGETREPVPMPALLRKGSARDNTFQWIHKAIVSLALRGNAYGLVVARDDMEFPIQVEWLNPDDVYVDETSPAMPVYYVWGKRVNTEDIVHIPWIVPPGKVKGLSPISAFASTLGVGIRATDYGARWFDTGTPPATMRNTEKTVTPDESAEIRDRLMSAMRQGKPLVFGNDWEFSALRVSPEESQFIETLRLNATQIASIYGVPAEMVGGETGGSLTYSTVEQNSINLTQLTLRPWVVRLEYAINDMIPYPEFVKLNLDAMVRTDLLTRYQAHEIALRNGWRNADETRAIEDEPPLPDGMGQGYGQTQIGGPQ